MLILIGIGVFATIMRFADYPLAPLLIGFILGQMMEDNFGRAMRNADGISFIWERPITLALLILAVVLVFLPAWRARQARRKPENIEQD